MTQTESLNSLAQAVEETFLPWLLEQPEQDFQQWMEEFNQAMPQFPSTKESLKMNLDLAREQIKSAMRARLPDERYSVAIRRGNKDLESLKSLMVGLNPNEE
jgi:hypothetical protein